jgi:hypothetical protein
MADEYEDEFDDEAEGLQEWLQRGLVADDYSYAKIQAVREPLPCCLKRIKFSLSLPAIEHTPTYRTKFIYTTALGKGGKGERGATEEVRSSFGRQSAEGEASGHR